MARSDLVKLHPPFTHPPPSLIEHLCVCVSFGFFFMCWDYCVFFLCFFVSRLPPLFFIFTSFNYNFYLQFSMSFTSSTFTFTFFLLSTSNQLFVSQFNLNEPPFSSFTSHFHHYHSLCPLLTSNIHLNPYITSPLIALTCSAVPSFRPPSPPIWEVRRGLLAVLGNKRVCVVSKSIIPRSTSLPYPFLPIPLTYHGPPTPLNLIQIGRAHV